MVFFFSFFRYYKKKIHLKYKRLYLKKIRRKVISLKNIMRKKSFFYNTFNSFKFFCKLLDIRKKFNMYKFKGVFKSREFFLGLRSKIVNVIKPIPLRKKRVRRKRLVFNGFLILSFLLFYDFEFRRLKLKKIAKLCRIMKSIFYPKRIKKRWYKKIMKARASYKRKVTLLYKTMFPKKKIKNCYHKKIRKVMVLANKFDSFYLLKKSIIFKKILFFFSSLK